MNQNPKLSNKGPLLAIVLFCLTVNPHFAGDLSHSVNTGYSDAAENFVSDLRSLDNFHSVILNGIAQVNISFGEEQAVSLTVSEGFARHIQTNVKNGALTIDLDQEIPISNPNIIINITMTDLKALALNGIGNIHGINKFSGKDVSIRIHGIGDINLELESENLNSSITGNGNLRLNGSVLNHHAAVMSLGNLEAFDLVTDSTSIIMRGVGNAEINATRKLEAQLSGVGSLYIKGHPAIVKKDIGIGSIIDSN